jgi:hypothetical protein
VAVFWGDVPGLSDRVGSWPRSWQQFWQQLGTCGACVMLPSASGPLPGTPSTLSALCAWSISFFGNDLVAQIDALVADRHAGTGNELFDLLLALSAKRAGELGSASFAAALLPGADVTV